MCFPRKLSLGRYNASRAEWETAYRAARIDAREGRKCDPVHDGVRWKAYLIVAFERDRAPLSVHQKLFIKKLIRKMSQ